jgi:hypothetical protein
MSDYPRYMDGTDSAVGRADQAAQEIRVRIGLVAHDWVSNDLLEELTLCVEDALSEHAGEVAPGASASASFRDRSIELDFSAIATPSQVHLLAAEVLQVAMDALNQHADRAAVSFGSSSTSPVLVAA